MKKSINDLTSNQYYKGLNNRFDNRVKKLFKLGFVYNRDKVAFKSPLYTETNPNAWISNSTIMHSDKRHFNKLINKL